jgi:hypothetical protein
VLNKRFGVQNGKFQTGTPQMHDDLPEVQYTMFSTTGNKIFTPDERRVELLLISLGVSVTEDLLT